MGAINGGTISKAQHYFQSYIIMRSDCRLQSNLSSGSPGGTHKNWLLKTDDFFMQVSLHFTIVLKGKKDMGFTALSRIFHLYQADH